jgi:hypothetical protein
VAPLDGLTGGSLGAPDGTPADDGAGSGPFADGGGAGDDVGSSVSSDAGDQDTSTPGLLEDAAADVADEAVATADAGAGSDACAPTPLACDGTAHACDGVVNEGCPSAITIGAPGALQFLGGTASGGTPFDDPCPADQVLVGVGGTTGQWIDAVYGICGTVSLDVETSSDPYTYRVALSPGATLPTRGLINSTDTMWQANCPANQAVVGVAGKSGTAMDQITLSCAPLVISGSPGAFVLHQGNVTVLPPQGDTSGGGPFTPVTCPDPQVIGALGGGSGQWIDSLSIACVAPSIALVP